MSPEDVTWDYVQGLNDPVVHQFLEGPRQQRQSIESVRHYVAGNRASSTDMLLGLFVERRLRGTVRLHDVDPSAHTGWVGIALFDRTVWGQGWAGRMIRTVAHVAGTELGVDVLRAGIVRGNERSKRAFEKAGFEAMPDLSDARRCVFEADTATIAKPPGGSD